MLQKYDRTQGKNYLKMSVKEKFVLKWADYSTTVTAALQELRNMEELFDITLAVENK